MSRKDTCRFVCTPEFANNLLLPIQDKKVVKNFRLQNITNSTYCVRAQMDVILFQVFVTMNLSRNTPVLPPSLRKLKRRSQFWIPEVENGVMVCQDQKRFLTLVKRKLTRSDSFCGKCFADFVEGTFLPNRSLPSMNRTTVSKPSFSGMKW